MHKTSYALASKICSVFVMLVGLASLAQVVLVGKSFGEDERILYIGGPVLVVLGALLLLKNIGRGKVLLWVMLVLSAISSGLLLFYSLLLRMGANDRYVDMGVVFEYIKILLPPVLCIALFIWLMAVRPIADGKRSPRLGIVLPIIVAAVVIAGTVTQVIGYWPG